MKSEGTTLRVTGVDVESKTVTVEPTYDTAHPDYYVVKLPKKAGQDFTVSYWISLQPRLFGEPPVWRIGGYIHVDSRHWTLDELIAGKSGLQGGE